MVEQHANVFLNGSSCSLPSTGKTSQQAIWFRDESLKSQQQFYYRNCLGTIPVPHFATCVAVLLSFRTQDYALTTTAVKCAAEYGAEVFFQLAKHFHQTSASFAFTANCPVQLLHLAVEVCCCIVDGMFIYYVHFISVCFVFCGCVIYVSIYIYICVCVI